jgi:hypothetical protein
MQKMSIVSGAAALARVVQVRGKSGGVPVGRVVRNAVLMAGVVPAAYLAGNRRAQIDGQAQLDRIAELEHRLELLEREQVEGVEGNDADAPGARSGEGRRLRSVGPHDTVKVDKDRVASHYEVLASQLACERQIVELEGRLAAVERTESAVRPVWLVSANGVPTSFRRRG